MTKKTKSQMTIQALTGVERVTQTLTAAEADKYPLLSVHRFGETNYKIVAITLNGEKIDIEFVRMQS